MGLAGRPEHADAFVRFAVTPVSGPGKTDVYLAREVWEAMHGDDAHRGDDAHSREGGHRQGTDRLEVLLPGYGLCWLRFEWLADDG